MNKRYWPLLLVVGITMAMMFGLGDVSALEAMFQSPLPTPTSTATHTPTWTPTPTITPVSEATPTVGPPLLAPAALCGRVGDVVTVDGANFVASALVNITWSGMALGTTPSPVQADPAGRFRFTFVVPNDYAGPHLVRASDGLRVAQFTFSLGQDCLPPTPTETSTPVPSPTPTEIATPTTTPPAEEPRLRCEPDASVPEQVIYVYGENFHPGGHFYQLRWDGVVIPWAPDGLTVGDDGKFTLWFAAPSDSYEIHTLVADDGKGGLAECYIDLMPRDPTPTWTPTPTLTPTPTATWTPGPPPRITVTPTLEPSPFEYCMEADAVFTRDPLVDTRVDAGIVLTNTNTTWEDNRVQVAIWQYYRLQASDTGVRFSLPSLTGGESLTLRQQFQTTQYAGPVWFQVRLLNTLTGQASVCTSPCTSPWFVLYAQDDEPYAPPLIKPPDNVWLDSRELDMDWLAAGIPDGAGPVDSYEVHLMDLGSGDLLYQQTGADMTQWSHQLYADYGARQLAWRARAHNSGGWGRWATAFYFGVDTIRPVVDIALAGTAGTNDWWVSPLTVRVGGSDPAPGSGLKATYLQIGDGRWEQVIPGGASETDLEGEFKLRAYGRDWALNRSLMVVEPVKVDLLAPHYLDAVFAYDATSSGWYTAPVTISVTAEDAVSGVAQRLVRVDGGGWQADEVTVTTEGIHDIEFMARDVAGNETQIRQTTAKLDLTPPSGAIALNGALCQTCDPMIASVASGDGASGLGHWTLSMALPQASLASRAGLASPLRQGETVLASGSDPSEEITLDGGELPVGDLVLRLAVQDVAGWVSTQAVTVTNAGVPSGPTPTPWLMATATPWPTTTPGALAYATITPTPGSSGGGGGDDDDDDDGGGGGGGDGSGGGGGSAGYPVGGTVVPAILPVTGSEGFSPALLLLAIPLLVFIGRLCRQQVYRLFFESDEDFMLRMEREGLLNHDDRSIEQ